ncbi:unnamed protein product [Rotaria sp. Silwood1]|nr:unnamed protein product [Rotaria sp. Silwood1]CAF0866266.1 unnamed protein product [Rotaria sp. Silwood1]CAF3357300.1 unnamed protein product [Rotaria sp. Silwood1]CAF3382052.1 unnamed protein product [Rotaria sp. Silwood1]CAF3389143.1 unnamed protein product [Rotaria sp. Silwood1]
MKRSFNLLLIRRFRPLYNCYRHASNKKYEGIREKIDENQARINFDKWIKSLWFAPDVWTQSTKDDAITITRRYLPFWNLSLQGSINASVDLAYITVTKQGKNIVPTQRWHSIPMTINNLSLHDINIYAAQTLDRYHLNKLNISFHNQNIVNLNCKENDVEQWTVDRDTTFQIGWDLNIVPQIKHLCVQNSKQLYPQYNTYQVKSFHFDIYSKQERLLYYPIYVVNYQYGSQSNFTCLVDGITGQVIGDRQYSMTKVTLATLIGFYPMVLTALFGLGSFIDPSIGILLASLLSFKVLVPIAFIVSPLAGLCAKYYPKFYRQRINEQQWQNYRSNSSQFTYDFTSSFQQKYQSYRQQQQQQQQYQQQYRQQQQQRTRESASRREEEAPMDLYNLLSVSRTATEKEIKRAYLLKAKELHPDRNPGDKKAEELFKKVNQAYAILSDKYKREQYDKYGYESVKYN